MVPDAAGREGDAAEPWSDHHIMDGERFFLRGALELPVIGSSQTFAWGVWASPSEKSLRRAMDLRGREARENEPPYFGWPCTALPGYPDTLFPKTTVHELPVGLRSLIEPEPTERPPAVEQK